MKQFNLDEYLKDPSQKVVTRGGSRVRMLCTDALTDNYPIVALVLEDEEETAYSYSKEGMFYHHGGDGCHLDLFFADKEPSYRPYANAEECFKDAVKHGGWVKKKACDYYRAIYSIEDNGVLFHDYDGLMEYYVWADDGSPCGVKEG